VGNNPLIITPEDIIIRGRYYTVSNGFLTKADGEVVIKRKNLLSADWVKRRSKRAMYGVLILGSLLIALLSYIQSNFFTVETDLQSMYGVFTDVIDITRHGRDSEFIQSIRGFITTVMVLTGIVTLAGAGYVFSGRQYAEITTMHGIYRIEAKRGDINVRNAVLSLRG